MGNRKDRKKKEKKKGLKHRYAKPEPGPEGEGPMIFFEPRGEVKMSEVLLDFIRPYHETEEQMGQLLPVAIVAWNAAVEGGSRGEELIRSTMAALPPDAQEDYLALVVELVERKLKYFANNTRLIIDYQPTTTPDGPHLSVISTLDV